MACITFAAPMAMATMQLARVAQHHVHEDASTRQLGDNVERNSPRLSWIVTSDIHGNRKLQMQWAPSEDIL